MPTTRAKPLTPRLRHRLLPGRASFADCLPLAERGGTSWANLGRPGLAATAASGPPTPATAEPGRGVRCTGGAALQIVDGQNFAVGDFTVRMIHRPTTLANFTALFDKGGATANRDCSIFFDSSGNLDFFGIGQTGSGTISTPTGMAAGSVWDFVLTRTGGTAYAYVNGALKGTFASSASTGFSTPYAWNLGANPSTGGVAYDGVYFLFQTWRGYALSAREVAALAGPDPYATIRSPRPAAAPAVLAAPAATAGNPLDLLLGF